MATAYISLNLIDAPKLIILGVADGEIRRLEVDNSHPA